MNGMQYALRRVHEGENQMHEHLLRSAERHHAEHEVHHVCRDMADWSQEHVRRVADAAKDFDLDLSAGADSPSRLTEKLRSATSTVIGKRPESGIVLLEDLRDVYLQGSENSLAWEMLAQIAQAQHERELLALSEECHPQTLRQIRWANTMLKTQTPQALSSLGS
jgi:hypothetical protein